ncbi:MAG: YdbH domain-containing protein [Nitrospirota bacterium]|nr:YdbH domain-containing protein [Nitrospirota bacterium]MDP2382854.1 YdbH domain-containing protein [Nitrospirota bacterium]MDP3595761.1 YdbH domain-containing protein [Nitrospirota bacterium]
MLIHRYQVALLLGLVALVSLYLLLPLTASYLLAQGLRQYGYKHVIIQLGYPGWSGMHIPVVSFQQELAGESVMVSLTNAEIQYRVPQLIHGHVDRVSLPYVAIQILNLPPSGLGEEGGAVHGRVESEDSPWTLLTAGDLLRGLPILPFEELHLDHVTIFREQATGPLRRVTISGVVMYRDGELGGHLSFQGRDTATYGLTVTGHSASTWSATLASQRPQAEPIISWQSQAHPEGSKIQVNGRLEVNVRELAPFIALLIPIGPELGRVTGQVAVRWAGTAAADATLESLQEDSRTQLDGQVQVNVTLPGLKGIAKDIAVAYEGTFTGTATEVGWTLEPGVLLTATVNAQPKIIPEAIRMMLPRGDQPLRIDSTKPVQGKLYWADSPVRVTAEGPLHVTYGLTPGPLVAEFETSRAEGVGGELVLAEGTFRVEGVLPKAVTDLLSAREATGGFRGTVTLARTHVKGILLPSSSVIVKQIEQEAVVASSVTLQLDEALTVQCDIAATHCTAGLATVEIRAPGLRVMGRRVRMAEGILRVQQAETTGTAWNAQGVLAVNGLAVDLAPWGLPSTDWKVRFSADQAGIKADLRVDALAREGLITAKIEQPLSQAKGVLHGTIGPMGFDAAERRLSKLLMGLPLSTDVIDGQLTATFDASWSGGLGDSVQGFQVTSGTAKIVADKLSGHYRDYSVKGVSATMALRADGFESIATVQPVPVTIASLQTGVEVTNLSTLFQVKWRLPNGLPVIDVKDFQCDVFGGSVTSPGLLVDLAKRSYQSTFSLRSLDLAKILSVEQQKGLLGTGTLNGTLPLTITPDGVVIEGGVVEAQPPGGVIRYLSTPESSKIISESDSPLSLVSQALNNFHYTRLRVGVEYAETGMLDLSARLEGRNPDLAKSPPIHFNLTVQEHIPTLMNSLRLTQDIQDTVQKKLKRP